MKKQLTFLVLSILFLYNYAVAQDKKPETKPFVLGVVHTIESVQLAETRTLNIYLPEGYDANAAATYPVIYLLDGSADEDFIHIAGLVQFLNFPWINVLPKSIVVGIANVDRKRDYTFPTNNKQHLKDNPTSGGSEKFMAFIQKELQPFIEKNYKVNTQRTIIGQSLGGLLATQILLKKPSLFNNYIIISPSLWWDDESILTDAEKTLKKLPADNYKVFLSVGTEGKQMENDVDRFAGILRRVSSSEFKVYYYPLPAENHATILHRAVYRAFEVMNEVKK